MNKACLLICMAIAMCLTACKTEKNKETPVISNTAPEITADVKADQEEAPKEMEKFELTDKGKAFLAQMCRELNDFDSQTTKDAAFWQDFLFNSYTGVSPEGAETEQVYREDLGFEETVVKISRQEAEDHAKLVFGTELPDIKPSFDDMEDGQTSCYYQDGYYYIGVSDFPDYQYTFADCEEADGDITIKYNIDFEGESNVGTVSFTIVPEDNENGFVIRSKTSEFSAY